MKDNKALKIVFVIVISIILAIVVVIYYMINNKEMKLEKNLKFIEISPNNRFDYNTKYKVIKTYEEFTDYFSSSKISKSDFINNNYLVIKVDYNPCSDEDITPTDLNIKGTKVDIGIKYRAVCGLCAPDDIYYAIKVDKNLTDPKVAISYKSVNNPHCDPNVSYKPMIYLYPTEKTEVKLILKNKKLLTTTYPKYNNGWEVIADVDGTLIDKESGREYYGLYWEGKNYTKIDMKKGFVVKGENTTRFLEEKLNELGLTDKEAEEFIVYWLPKLEGNKYNYIYFAQTKEVNEYMPLEITPEPDSMIRILMYYKPLNKKITVKEEKIKTIYRKDFTVVEWGGTEIK